MTTTERKPVDVLAKIDKQIARITNDGKLHDGDANGLREACAAVAELIEAVEAYREADREYGSLGYGSEGERLLREKLAAADRVDAALARVQGGA